MRIEREHPRRQLTAQGQVQENGSRAPKTRVGARHGGTVRSSFAREFLFRTLFHAADDPVNTCRTRVYHQKTQFFIRFLLRLGMPEGITSEGVPA